MINTIEYWSIKLDAADGGVVGRIRGQDDVGCISINVVHFHNFVVTNEMGTKYKLGRPLFGSKCELRKLRKAVKGLSKRKKLERIKSKIRERNGLKRGVTLAALVAGLRVLGRPRRG